MRGVITSYKVNGIDSLDDIGKYLNCYYTNSFRDIDFNTIDTKNRNRVYNSCFGQIAYGWNSDYNFLYVYHQNDTNEVKRNIFLGNGNNWKVLKFIPSKKTINHQLKIQYEINGNTYEIQFN